jgi:hypothetical protein
MLSGNNEIEGDHQFINFSPIAIKKSEGELKLMTAPPDYLLLNTPKLTSAFA